VPYKDESSLGGDKSSYDWVGGGERVCEFVLFLVADPHHILGEYESGLHLDGVIQVELEELDWIPKQSSRARVGSLSELSPETTKIRTSYGTK